MEEYERYYELIANWSSQMGTFAEMQTLLSTDCELRKAVVAVGAKLHSWRPTGCSSCYVDEFIRIRSEMKKPTTIQTNKDMIHNKKPQQAPNDKCFWLLPNSMIVRAGNFYITNSNINYDNATTAIKENPMQLRFFAQVAPYQGQNVIVDFYDPFYEFGVKCLKIKREDIFTETVLRLSNWDADHPRAEDGEIVKLVSAAKEENKQAFFNSITKFIHVSTYQEVEQANKAPEPPVEQVEEREKTVAERLAEPPKESYDYTGTLPVNVEVNELMEEAEGITKPPVSKAPSRRK